MNTCLLGRLEPIECRWWLSEDWYITGNGTLLHFLHCISSELILVLLEASLESLNLKSEKNTEFLEKESKKIRNGIKLILDDQKNHLNSYIISLKLFRSFRCHLFRKLLTGQDFFFAVSYNKPALMQTKSHFSYKIWKFLGIIVKILKRIQILYVPRFCGYPYPVLDLIGLVFTTYW